MPELYSSRTKSHWQLQMNIAKIRTKQELDWKAGNVDGNEYVNRKGASHINIANKWPFPSWPFPFGRQTID